MGSICAEKVLHAWWTMIAIYGPPQQSELGQAATYVLLTAETAATPPITAQASDAAIISFLMLVSSRFDRAEFRLRSSLSP
jgi:hypothetical protein